MRKRKILSCNFELRDVSEFREASRESLFLTGTPSVRNLKLNAAILCAGNPSHCRQLRVLRRFSAFACLCWYSQRNGSKHYLMNATITRDCREYSRYSRSSVGNPDLKKKILTRLKSYIYNMQLFTVFTANFENVLKIRYNDARLR